MNAHSNRNGYGCRKLSWYCVSCTSRARIKSNGSEHIRQRIDSAAKLGDLVHLRIFTPVVPESHLDKCRTTGPFPPEFVNSDTTRLRGAYGALSCVYRRAHRAGISKTTQDSGDWLLFLCWVALRLPMPLRPQPQPRPLVTTRTLAIPKRTFKPISSTAKPGGLWKLMWFAWFVARPAATVRKCHKLHTFCPTK